MSYIHNIYYYANETSRKDRRRRAADILRAPRHVPPRIRRGEKSTAVTTVPISGRSERRKRLRGNCRLPSHCRGYRLGVRGAQKISGAQLRVRPLGLHRPQLGVLTGRQVHRA